MSVQISIYNRRPKGRREKQAYDKPIETERESIYLNKQLGQISI